MGLLVALGLLVVLLGEGGAAGSLDKRWREPEEAWLLCSRCERMLPRITALERNPSLLADSGVIDFICTDLQPYMNCMKRNSICLELSGINPLPALEFICSNTDAPASLMRCVEGEDAPGFYRIVHLCNSEEDNLFGYSLSDNRLCTTARSFSACVMKEISNCSEEAKTFARGLSDILLADIRCLQ